MPYTIYNCDALTGGGTRALDALPIATLSDGERAFAMVGGKFLPFRFNASETDAEDTTDHPFKVRPDDYSTAGVWEEQEAGAADGLRTASTHTATAGQTAFVHSRTVENEFVFLNGVLLTSGTDYTVSTDTVTLSTGAAAGDVLTIVTTANAVIADAVAKTGDTMTGALILAGNPAGALYAVPKQYADVGKNLIINPEFEINQEVVTIGSHSADEYFRDQWKAGASGVTASLSGGVLTITAGSALQPIEDVNIPNGSYTISWEGTAQVKIDGGGAQSSPHTFTVATGTHVEIEFTTGTVQRPVLVAGSVSVAFKRPDFGKELRKCRRYFEMVYSFLKCGSSNIYLFWVFYIEKRVVPTVTEISWPRTGTDVFTSQTCYGGTFTTGTGSYSGNYYTKVDARL